MKKILFIAFMCVSAFATSAQTYDTLYNRVEECYYNYWYDTCDCFLKGGRFNPLNVITVDIDPNDIGVHPAFTPDSMEVKGVMLFVNMNISPSTYHLDQKLPEYAMLYQYDNNMDTLLFLDSARWDTLTPKIMKWPKGVDTALRGFYYCYAYAAYFDHPIMVDSTFFVGGTQNSNVWNCQFYKPTEYMFMYTQPACGCKGENGWHWSAGEGRWKNDSMSHIYNNIDGDFGGFLPIVEKYRLDGDADNPAFGMVEGTGLFPNRSRQTITAIPRQGCRFLHWNDGDTTNPRTVRLMQDTAFTAHFYPGEEPLSVRAVANDNRRGRVTGGGSYYWGEVAELTASPYEPYVFTQWNDGDTSNPRQVVVTQDTSFTAYFDTLSDTTGIAIVSSAASFFTLTPNPTDGKVVVEVKSDKSGDATITLCDATGREVLKQKASVPTTLLDLSKLPAGTYFVTVTIGGQSGTRKLVVK